MTLAAPDELLAAVAKLLAALAVLIGSGGFVALRVMDRKAGHAPLNGGGKRLEQRLDQLEVRLGSIERWVHEVLPEQLRESLATALAEQGKRIARNDERIDVLFGRSP